MPLILSLFLRNIENEEKKDINSNNFFLNEIESAKKTQKKVKFDSTTKNKIYLDRISSNVLDIKDEFNKICTISSLNQNYIRANSQQFTINNKKNSIKRRKTTRKTQDKSSFYKTKRKASLIKDNDTNESVILNSSLGISSNQNINYIKKTKTNSLEIGRKNNLKTIKSVGVNNSSIKKNVKNNSIQKYSTMKNENEYPENKSKIQLKNTLKIFNRIKKAESKEEINGDSILNDNSKLLLKKLTESKSEIKIVDHLKDSSFIAKNLQGTDITNKYVNKNKSNSIIRTSNISISKKEDISPRSKKSSISISAQSNKSSLIGSAIRKKRRIAKNKGFRGLMRAITSSSGIHKSLLNKDANKLLRVETALKSLQEQIKKTIILRPEDLVLDLSDGLKPFINKQKTKEKQEPKKNISSQSLLPNFIKKNEIDISKKNSNDIKKPDNIPTIIQNIDKNSEQIYQVISKDLLKNETVEELPE